ncbi:membrane-bound lytic murein transglycosylase D [Vibrio paracholerae]|uniref:LysM peptidoglycan-binding domain-containing protein n=1 Tax=Vibrio paracholerae TaxID=650003 RepID=UPI000E5AE7F5|nr:LysM peptidoglycan-binding domain-containing protein [Vibrio paracholerae]SYZ80723.1 membrane-bound lytic murein transglycosylase D [Vibrio paracholerae]
MRVKFSWVLALLLVGCQSPQPVDTTTSDDYQVETPSTESVLVKPKRKPPSTATLAAQAKEPESMAEKAALSPQQQGDMWQRIVMQFQLKVPDNPSVEKHRQWFIKNTNHIESVTARAEPFLYLLSEKMEQKGLPLELILIPFLESSFDPSAQSPSNAAGLWQFISSTGKLYGLKQNFWYDGRMDVEASTDAALNYFTRLNKHFNGDWYLTLAAYNSGEGRVDRAIQANKKAGKPTDLFSLNLPKETMDYVPRVLALADVIANSEKYGISLPTIDNSPALRRVDPKEPLDLAIAAHYAGMTARELKSLNPAYRQWATAPTGPHHLLIPLNNAGRFEQAVEENRGKDIRLVRYKVKSGDTLGTIAAKYNTNMAAIKQANQLKSNQVKIGDSLLVPTSISTNKNAQRLAAAPATNSTKTPRGQYQVNHTVASGESLWSLAKQYNVSSQQLAQWNNLSAKEGLRKGQKLVIWKETKQNSIRSVVYQVRSGDTLNGIAKRFKVKTSDISKWNELSTNQLKVGQKLKIQVDMANFTSPVVDPMLVD